MNGGLAYLLALAAGALVWLFVARTWRTTMIGSIVVQEPERGLLVNVEGLRGFLAFSVFLHHAIITRAYLETGRWIAPAFHPSTLLGEGGVSLFFIITAFLFWGKVLRGEGHLQLLAFYKGRVLRLAPLYLGITAVVVISSLIASPDLAQQGVAVLVQVGRWVTLGILGMPDIAGVNSQRYVASVFWSLQYEWAFYLLLPLLMLVLRTPAGQRATPYVLMALFPLSLLHHTVVVSRILLFAGGMLCAHFWADERVRAWTVRPMLWQGLLVLCLLTTTLFHTAYNPVQAGLFTIIFFCILNMPAMTWAGHGLRAFVSRALGAVSYSIYMVHGLVLYALSHLVPATWVERPLGFFLFVLGCGLIVVSLSMLTFRMLEHPFFRKGRRSIREVIGWRPRTLSQ